MADVIRIGTRGSKLAVAQAEHVLKLLRSVCKDVDFEIKIIKTSGDRDTSSPLWQSGIRGFFTKEIEEALLSGEIDIAVHSLKDMPSKLPKGLMLAGTTQREDPRDVLISNKGWKLNDLPEGVRVGTGSSRRAAFLRAAAPKVEVVPVRGNLDTRLKKLQKGEINALILAKAGLSRLNIDVRLTFLDPSVFVPQACQGAIGIEIRESDIDGHVGELVRAVNHKNSWLRVRAERSLLEALGLGCQAPFGCLAEITGDSLLITARMCDESRRIDRVWRLEGQLKEPEEVGINIAKQILKMIG